MSLHKYIERLSTIDHHISTKATGNTEVLAHKLGISISGTYDFLDQMRDEGFPIKYSKKENRFYYDPKGKTVGYVFVKDTGNTDAVQLRFSAYPYQEVGFVKGKLDFISKIATDSGLYATVRLDNGLTTNLKNHIQYKNGLKAEAIVITKNMRLLQRMYYSVVKATSVGK